MQGGQGEEEDIANAWHLKRSLFVEQAVHSQEIDALPKICPEKIDEVAPVEGQPEGASAAVLSRGQAPLLT